MKVSFKHKLIVKVNVFKTCNGCIIVFKLVINQNTFILICLNYKQNKLKLMIAQTYAHKFILNYAQSNPRDARLLIQKLKYLHFFNS